MPDLHNARGMTPEQAFAQDVRSIRESLGWSQEELARRVSIATGMTIHQTGIARIEGGRRNIRLDEAVALGHVLGIDMGGVSLMPAADLTDTERDLVKALEQGRAILEEQDNASFQLQVEMKAMEERYARSVQRVAQTRMLIESLEQRLQEARAKISKGPDGE